MNLAVGPPQPQVGLITAAAVSEPPRAGNRIKQNSGEAAPEPLRGFCVFEGHGYSPGFIEKKGKQMNVLARRDSEGPYDPDNCYWREAQSEKEAQYGIEDIGLTEPEIIPLTRREEKQRAALPEEQKRAFDIWARMWWRAKHYGPGKQ